MTPVRPKRLSVLAHVTFVIKAQTAYRFSPAGGLKAV